MAFWSNASPVTKASLVVSVLALLYFGIAYVAGMPPFTQVDGGSSHRGIGSP